MSAKDEPVPDAGKSKAADNGAKSKSEGGRAGTASTEVSERDLDKIAGGAVGPCNMPSRGRAS
jgi:hypothetical protein